MFEVPHIVVVTGATGRQLGPYCGQFRGFPTVLSYEGARRGGREEGRGKEGGEGRVMGERDGGGIWGREMGEGSSGRGDKGGERRVIRMWLTCNRNQNKQKTIKECSKVNHSNLK